MDALAAGLEHAGNLRQDTVFLVSRNMAQHVRRHDTINARITQRHCKQIRPGCQMVMLGAFPECGRRDIQSDGGFRTLSENLPAARATEVEQHSPARDVAVPETPLSPRPVGQKTEDPSFEARRVAVIGNMMLNVVFVEGFRIVEAWCEGRGAHIFPAGSRRAHRRIPIVPDLCAGRIVQGQIRGKKLDTAW